MHEDSRMHDDGTAAPAGAKDPFDHDTLADIEEKLEMLRGQLGSLGQRLGQLELKAKTPDELEREVVLHQLVLSGFTEEQAEALVTLVETTLLHGQAHPLSVGPNAAVRERLGRRWRMPKEAERAWQEVQREAKQDRFGVPFEEPTMTACPPAHGVFQHPDLFDTFGPYVVAALPHVLTYVMSLLRPEPPRPWWQRQLRKLVGI